MSSSNEDYLLARAERERLMAAEAPDDLVREIHLKLAHEYSVRANVARVIATSDNDALGLISDDDRFC